MARELSAQAFSPALDRIQSAVAAYALEQDDEEALLLLMLRR